MTTVSTYATPIMLLLIAALGIAGMYASMNALDGTPTGLQAWGSVASCSQGWWGNNGDMQLPNGDTRFVCSNGQWWIWVKEWSGGTAPKTYAGTGWWWANPAQTKCQVVGDFYTRPAGTSGLSWGRKTDSLYTKECRNTGFEYENREFPNNHDPVPSGEAECMGNQFNSKTYGGMWWAWTRHGFFAGGDPRILCHNGKFYSPTGTWGGNTYQVKNCVQKGKYYTKSGRWQPGSIMNDIKCSENPSVVYDCETFESYPQTMSREEWTQKRAKWLGECRPRGGIISCGGRAHECPGGLSASPDGLGCLQSNGKKCACEWTRHGGDQKCKVPQAVNRCPEGVNRDPDTGECLTKPPIIGGEVKWG